MKNLIAVVALLSVMPFAFGQAAADRKGVLKAYERWERLITTRNMRDLPNVVHKDFVEVGLDGSRTGYKETAQSLPRTLASSRNFRSKSSFDRISIAGDEATVWARYDVRYEQKQGRKWQKVRITGQDVDTLKKVNGRWLFWLTQRISMKR